MGDHVGRAHRLLHFFKIGLLMQCIMQQIEKIVE